MCEAEYYISSLGLKEEGDSDSEQSALAVFLVEIRTLKHPFYLCILYFGLV